MTPLLALRQSFAQPGRVDWIGIRPDRKGSVVTRTWCDVEEDGLKGDHSRAGKRALTVIQAEHLPVIAGLSGRSAVAPELLRRNIVISGINLTALREFGIRIGDVRLEVTAPCAPCSRMEKALGMGGYTALRGHGGWCCRVRAPGTIALGDAVTADLEP